MRYPVRSIVEKTLDGIAKAQRDYMKLSGGYWLWQAPEYITTTYVAKQVSTIKRKNLYVTLEENVRQSVTDAGGSVRRRILRPSQAKFDIALWDGDTPKGVIEIKLEPRGFASIRNDVRRNMRYFARR